MLLPIGHDESEVRRLPWVTFALMALCVLILLGMGTTSCDGSLPEWEAQAAKRLHAAEERGETDPSQVQLPPTPYQDWGLIPSELRLSRLFTHQFVHAGWLHLAGNMLLLFLLGPPLEDRWGRPVFLALYLSGGVFAGLFYSFHAAGAATPLVGASGAIAGVMGAYLVRLFRSRLRYFYFLVFRMGTFEAPAWLMLPLWFVGELWSASTGGAVGGQGGVAYWAHVGGFLYGAAFAGVMRGGRLEERFLAAPLERKLVLAEGNPVLEEIRALQAEGHAEEAYEKLRSALRRQPTDPDVVVATWDAARALGRASEMAGALGAQIRRWVASGEVSTAAAYWCELTLAAPDARTDPRVLLAVARELDAQDRALEVRRALEAALSHAGVDLPPGLALRLFELARRRAPERALEAGRRALAWDQLPPARRHDLEQAVSELEARHRMQAAEVSEVHETVWHGPEDRALELDSTDEAAPAPPGPGPGWSTESRPVSAVATRGAESTGEGDSPTLPIDSGPRFRAVKCREVRPLALGPQALEVDLEGRRFGVPFARIQALAVGAVHGLRPGPVLLLDLALNWNAPDAETLEVLRLRSDRYDPRALSPGSADPLQAFRGLVHELASRSRAQLLPDAEILGDAPISSYPDLAFYERLVLDLSG